MKESFFHLESHRDLPILEKVLSIFADDRVEFYSCSLDIKTITNDHGKLILWTNVTPENQIYVQQFRKLLIELDKNSNKDVENFIRNSEICNKIKNRRKN